MCADVHFVLKYSEKFCMRPGLLNSTCPVPLTDCSPPDKKGGRQRVPADKIPECCSEETVGRVEVLFIMSYF